MIVAEGAGQSMTKIDVEFDLMSDPRHRRSLRFQKSWKHARRVNRNRRNHGELRLTEQERTLLFEQNVIPMNIGSRKLTRGERAKIRQVKASNRTWTRRACVPEPVWSLS